MNDGPREAPTRMTTDSQATPAQVPRPAAAPTHQRLDAFAIGLMTSMCICLAVGQVAIKVANAGISPVLQAGLRSLAGAVLLMVFAWARGVRLFARDGIFWPALLTSLFFTAEFAFLYPGLALTTAAHAVILLYMAPFVVAVGAHFLIPGDRLTAMKLGGLALALAGVAVIVLGKDGAAEAPAVSGQGPSLTGDLLCLAGAFAWGGLTLTIRSTRLVGVAPERISFIQLAVSGVLLCGLSPLLGEAGFTDPTPLAWAGFAFTVLFVAGFVFTTTTWLFTRYPASRVMAFMLLTPGFGVVAAHLLLGEPVGPSLLAGLALVLAGLWLVNRPPATVG
jgi:drug/metabolite transporter (DMT)-like permease